MDWTDLALQLLAALAPVALAAITYASAWLARYLRARTQGEYWSGVIDRLEEATQDVVAELEQTTVRGIREANADGKLTPTEAREVREQAVAKVLEYVGPKGRATAERIMDREALEAIVRAKIEHAVLELQRGGAL
jgi:hypothetical protein